MLKNNLPIFDVTLDPEYSLGGEYLGIDRISNVKNPAVKIKGVAFSEDYPNKLYFTDARKLRIVAPILVPDNIYRNDEDGEYALRFTPEIIEVIAKEFMRTQHNYASTTGLFNRNHEDESKLDAYILESILVDSESKVKMIRDSYGMTVPLGSFVIVQQFNNKEEYSDIVEKGETGFSIEGFLGMMIPEFNKSEVNINKEKFNKMSKKKKFVGVKRTFKTASKKKMEEVVESEDLIIVADDLKEGEEVVVIEDVVTGAVENFSGEVDTVVDGENKVLIIEDNKIIEVVSEEEEKVAEVADEAKEVVMEVPAEEVEKVEEKVEEVVMAEEVVTPETPATETPEAEVVNYDEKLKEIYDMIAEIKAQLLELSTKEEVVLEPMKQNFSTSLSAFNEWNKRS